MKRTLFGVVLLLAGCSSVAELHRLDRSYGQAGEAAWQQQTAYPDNHLATMAPEGLPGISAEEIMGVYNGTFAEKPAKQEFFQFNVGQRK